MSELELYFGKTNLVNRSDDFINYLHFQLRVQNDILKTLTSGEKFNKVTTFVEKINEVLNV